MATRISEFIHIFFFLAHLRNFPLIVQYSCSLCSNLPRDLCILGYTPGARVLEYLCVYVHPNRYSKVLISPGNCLVRNRVRLVWVNCSCSLCLPRQHKSLQLFRNELPWRRIPCQLTIMNSWREKKCTCRRIILIYLLVFCFFFLFAKSNEPF